MNWLPLTSIAEVESIKNRSHEVPCMIFKHSTTCSISAIAKDRLERDWDFSETELPAFYLDLLKFRPVSGFIAETFEIHHESPQLLVISNGECIYDASHLDISVDELKEALESVA